MQAEDCLVFGSQGYATGRLALHVDAKRPLVQNQRSVNNACVACLVYALNVHSASNLFGLASGV